MGGAGADVLSGGPGANRFVYTSVYEGFRRRGPYNRLLFGDVEDDDILADAGTVFIDTGAYTPGPAAGEIGGPHFGAPALHGHFCLA